MSLSHSPLIVRDGLVLCLDAANPRSYPKSGTTWSDLKGSNDGTLTNMTDNFNQDDKGSLSFDGSNEYVIVDSPWTSSGGSLFVWFKGSSGVMCGSYGGSGNKRSPTIFINSGNLKYEFLNILSGNTISTFLANTWYNVCLTYDSSFNTKVYLNSILTNQATASSDTFWSSETIGRYGNFGSNFFNGNVSSYICYNRALTASEVLQNYLATKGRYE